MRHQESKFLGTTLNLSMFAVAVCCGLTVTAAVHAGGTYVYTADLENDTLHSGAVYGDGINWRCRRKECTAEHNEPHLGLRWCRALAGRVGAIKRYGHRGYKLGRQDLDYCNMSAATQDSDSGSYVTLGGSGVDKQKTELPGLSGKDDGEGGSGPVIEIERVEVITQGGLTHVYVRGDNFPTPWRGHSVVILPRKHPNCYGVCAQQYMAYENELGRAQPGRWETDILGVDLYTFRPDPSTEEFFAQLGTMVEAHDVMIRDGAGYQIAHATIPVSSFGFVETDVDGDGHKDVKWHGDDCDDTDASRYRDCPEEPAAEPAEESPEQK